MNCSDLDQFLHPYLDGEFEAGDAAAVEHHLATCESCQRAVDEALAFRAKLRQAYAAKSSGAPQGLRAKISAGLAQEQRRLNIRPFVRAGAFVGLAAAISFGVVSYRQNTERRYFEEAAARHARGLPFEVQNMTAEDVERWFGGKLLHRVQVPQFRNSVLAGARLSNVSDKEAAYLSYETEHGSSRRRMGLFVFQDAADRLNAPTLPTVQVRNAHGYNVALWREGEIVYELVTDLNEQDIRQLLQHDTRRATPQKHVAPAATPSLDVQPAAYGR